MVKDIGRSGIYLSAISNRLAAASTQSRFLGMIVGTAISQLIEQPGKTLRFDLEEMESEEARGYLNLVKTNDGLGSLDSLKPQKEAAMQRPDKKSSAPPPQPRSQRSKVVAIEEIDEDEDGVEEIPYENPNLDESDSEDDPTVANRPKPTPPV